MLCNLVQNRINNMVMLTMKYHTYNDEKYRGEGLRAGGAWWNNFQRLIEVLIPELSVGHKIAQNLFCRHCVEINYWLEVDVFGGVCGYWCTGLFPFPQRSIVYKLIIKSQSTMSSGWNTIDSDAVSKVHFDFFNDLLLISRESSRNWWRSWVCTMFR